MNSLIRNQTTGMSQRSTAVVGRHGPVGPPRNSVTMIADMLIRPMYSAR